jgi:hypothetical protein
VEADIDETADNDRPEALVIIVVWQDFELDSSRSFSAGREHSNPRRVG